MLLARHAHARTVVQPAHEPISAERAGLLRPASLDILAQRPRKQPINKIHEERLDRMRQGYADKRQEHLVAHAAAQMSRLAAEVRGGAIQDSLHNDIARKIMSLAKDTSEKKSTSNTYRPCQERYRNWCLARQEGCHLDGIPKEVATLPPPLLQAGRPLVHFP
jgi:hypothetical protein